MMKKTISTINLVSIGLFLAIGFFSVANAQNIETLPNCDGGCIKKLSEAVISHDSSFVLAGDSSVSGEPGIALKKYNFKSSEFTNVESIPLIQNGTEAPFLNISLSQNNEKVSVYREPVETENTLVQIVNLLDNSIKELSSVNTSGLQIGLPAFLDKEGKTLIASTIGADVQELVSIDIESDTVQSLISLPDKVQTLSVSPSFKKVLLTYTGVLAQSVSVYDVSSNSLETLEIDPSFSFSVDDFLNKVEFDLFGNRAVISSLGGNHVLHFLDLEKNKLSTKILDRFQEGTTLSVISPDGKTVISAGNILEGTTGFKIYKTTISKDSGVISQTGSVSFLDGSIVLDVDITPDESKIYVLVLKDDSKQLYILNLKTLVKEDSLDISSDNTQGSLSIAPNGSFAVSGNSGEGTVSLIKNLNLGPVFKSVIPNLVPIGIAVPFTINGFINPLEFDLKETRVCFANTNSCAASVNVSRDGQKITGITPKLSSLGFEDVILVSKSFSDEIKTSKYEGVLTVLKDAATIADTFIPEITLLAPKDSSILNRRRVLILGKADGTGSGIENVLVNGKSATLSSEGQASPNIVNFISDLQLDSDGIFEINVTAKDKSGNESQKTVKVTVDTVIPLLSADIEVLGTSQFKVTGTCNGTGSGISSILVNSQPVQFTSSLEVSFTATTSILPIIVTVFDKAGNKNELKISSPQATDKTPPVITVQSPSNGQIFKGEENMPVTFSVSDDTSVKEVFLNGELILPLSSGNSNQYSQSIKLFPGENFISISAIDTTGNNSNAGIKITYIPQELAETKEGVFSDDFTEEKEVITLSNEIEDLNLEVIEQFTDLALGEDSFVDIDSLASLEISNPPPIPEGAEASIELPEVEGLEDTEGDLLEVPKGFSFASDIEFNSDEVINVTKEEKEKQNSAILVDSAGRTFLVGFAFLKEADNNLLRNKKHRFQTTGGNPLELITTFTVPVDANEGNATISVLSKNQALATIPLKIAPSKEVKIKKRVIAKPQIKDPIKATVKKSGKQLTLIIKGKNFVGKIATIDGKLEKLLSKTTFFTNVTFVPSDGINIKNLKVLKNKIVLNAELEDGIAPGVKLFNVITPRGADIGGIVVPDPVVNGKLETTSTPVELILGN